MFLGTAISQGILLGVTPILTRIYSPEDFGVYALFLSITAILSLVATLRYEMAIVIPKKDKDALDLVRLCAFFTVLFSIFLCLLVLLFGAYISELLRISDYKNFLFFVPLAVLLTGLFNSLYYFLTRKRTYQSVAFGLVGKASFSSAYQWISGLAFQSFFGLIFGQIVGVFTGFLLLLKGNSRVFSLDKLIETKGLRNQAIVFKRFPQYTLPGNLMNTLFLNGLPFLIIYFFSSFVLGQFMLVSRMLGIPARVFGVSMSQVYFQKIAASKNSGGDVLKIYKLTLFRLLGIALPVFGVLFIIAPLVFGFVFGKEWMVAGTYAQILIPVMGARFVSSALSPTLHVFERQDLTLAIQGIQLLTLLILFGLVFSMQLSFAEMLTLYSWVYSIEYTLFLYVYHYIVKRNS